MEELLGPPLPYTATVREPLLMEAMIRYHDPSQVEWLPARPDILAITRDIARSP